MTHKALHGLTSTYHFSIITHQTASRTEDFCHTELLKSHYFLWCKPLLSC